MSLFRRPVAASLVALFCAAAPARAAGPETYLPNDSDFVAGLDVKQLLDAPAVKKHGPALVARYGFDLLTLSVQDSPASEKAVKDHAAAIKKFLGNRKLVEQFLDGVRGALDGVLVAGNDANNSTMLVFHGDWDATKTEGYLETIAKFLGAALKPVEVGTRKMYELQAGEDDALFLAVPDKGVLVVADKKEHVEEALAKSAGKKKPELKKELRDLLAKADKKKTGWVVGYLPEEKQALAGSLAVAGGIEGEVTLQTGNADDAKEEAKNAKEGIDDLKMSVADVAKDRKELAFLVKLLEQVKVSTDDTRVTVKLQVPGKTLDELLKDGE